MSSRTIEDMMAEVRRRQDTLVQLKAAADEAKRVLNSAECALATVKSDLTKALVKQKMLDVLSLQDFVDTSRGARVES